MLADSHLLSVIFCLSIDDMHELCKASWLAGGATLLFVRKSILSAPRQLRPPYFARHPLPPMPGMPAA
jgi:hypothetical protein